jgi:hypothetical protein
MDFDNISEEDLMSVLGDMNLGSTSTTSKAPKEITNIPDELADLTNDNSTSVPSTLTLDGNSLDGLGEILKQLLQNKTIEITIKVKD